MYAFDEENPFYSTEDERRAMKEECEKFVIYSDINDNSIVIFFDKKDIITWIFYYKN